MPFVQTIRALSILFFKLNEAYSTFNRYTVCSLCYNMFVFVTNAIFLSFYSFICRTTGEHWSINASINSTRTHTADTIVINEIDITLQLRSTNNWIVKVSFFFSLAAIITMQSNCSYRTHINQITNKNKQANKCQHG